MYGEVPTLSTPTPCLPFFQTDCWEINLVHLINELIKSADIFSNQEAVVFPILLFPSFSNNTTSSFQQHNLLQAYYS
jgi:hypothetical protein